LYKQGGLLAQHRLLKQNPGAEHERPCIDLGNGLLQHLTQDSHGLMYILKLGMGQGEQL